MNVIDSEKEIEYAITKSGEQIAVKVRFYLVGFFLIGTTMAILNSGLHAITISYLIAILYYLIASLSTTYLIKTNKLKLWIIYFNAISEVLILYFLRILGVVLFPIEGYVNVAAKEKSLFLIYLIFIIMLPLRNNYRFSIVVGTIIIFAQISLQLIYANHGMNYKLGSNFSAGEIGLSSEVSVVFYIIACVFISCTITKIFNRYLSDSRKNERLAKESLDKTEIILSRIRDLKLQIQSAITFAQKFRNEFKVGIQSQIGKSQESTQAMTDISNVSRKISDSTKDQMKQIQVAEEQSDQLQFQFKELKKLIVDIKQKLQSLSLDLDKSKKALNSTETSMESIDISSKKIAGTLKDMNEISNRTNLLALNASIEAARAGEYGKGFSIVAEEVAKLARRSTSHNREIGDIIKDSLVKTTSGTESVSGISNSFKYIFSAFSSIDSKLDEGLSALTEFEKEKDNILQSIYQLSKEANFVKASTDQQEDAIRLTNEHILKLSKTASEFTEWLEELDTLQEFLVKTENLVSEI